MATTGAAGNHFPETVGRCDAQGDRDLMLPAVCSAGLDFVISVYHVEDSYIGSKSQRAASAVNVRQRE